MQGVLGVGLVRTDRQRRRKERQSRVDFKEGGGGGGGGGGVTGSLGRPAGVASHPALRRKSRLGTSARVGVRHLRISGQTGHRTVFVGTRLGEVYAMRENPEAESMGGLRGGAPLHEHLASHVRDPLAERGVVTPQRQRHLPAPHPTAAHVLHRRRRPLDGLNTRSRHYVLQAPPPLPRVRTCRTQGWAPPWSGLGQRGTRVSQETMAEVALLEFGAEAAPPSSSAPTACSWRRKPSQRHRPVQRQPRLPPSPSPAGPHIVRGVLDCPLTAGSRRPAGAEIL